MGVALLCLLVVEYLSIIEIDLEQHFVWIDLAKFVPSNLGPV